MEKLKNFVIWLDGFLDDKKSLNEYQTKKVSDKLNSLFEHEADNQKTGEPSKPIDFKPNLGQDFGPGYVDPITGEKYRC